MVVIAKIAMKRQSRKQKRGISMVEPQEVQYYSRLSKELKHSQRHKAELFLTHDCIQYDKENHRFICNPLDGYNKTSYTLTKNKDYPGGYECDCQFFQGQLKKGDPRACSHILALHLYFDNRNRLHGWGRHSKGSATMALTSPQEKNEVQIESGIKEF